MAIQAGQLRHVVRFEYFDNTLQDTTGQPLKTWTLFVGDVRAAIRPYSGRELYAASEKLAVANTRIKTRYFAGINEQMRIVHDGPNCCGSAFTLYDIVQITDPDMRHIELDLLCKSGLTDG